MRRLSARSRRSRRISPSLSPPVLWQVITSEYLHVKPLIGRWLHDGQNDWLWLIDSDSFDYPMPLPVAGSTSIPLVAMHPALFP